MVVIEHQKTQHYLEMARQIQLQMLPRDSPSVEGFSFAHYYRAAQLVGGDAYSYHTFRDGRIMLAVADASGKGLPASLRIAQFISELRHSVCTAPSLKAAMSELNAFVCQSEEGFITFCLAILDPQSNTLTIANAGHPLPILRNRDGTVIPVGQDRVSLPLGLIVDNPFHPISVELKIGDEFLFFTDGITEAFGPSGDIYGTERLYKCLRAPVQSAVERIQSVIADVEFFRRGRDPSDDQCVLVLRRESA
jgi:sigma-B regulation protein RsbU (phosphoserine phosphatase)